LIILGQLITSFIATGAFGILFNAPKQSLIKCGLIGMGGWFLYYIIEDYSGDDVLATVVATLFVGILSFILARAFKTPVIIFSVAGIIPLVPGGFAYNAMRNFVENHYNSAITSAAKVLLLSGAIAFGLVFAEVLNQVIRKIKPIKYTDKNSI
jgi:uncharacterized membrane protein YjjB (DUF3815 family)